MKNANEALVEYGMSLTDEQVNKLMERLDLLKQLVSLTGTQLTYTETLLDRLFGKESA